MSADDVRPAAPARLPVELLAEVEALRPRYPTEEALLLPVLHLAQKANGGWLSHETIGAVAELLGLPESKVAGVVSFYDMFHERPVGRHRIRLCTNLSCQLRGAEVAGRNFGLGSHRGPANTALVSLGFVAVIAESVARLFFRNSVAIGFHALQVPGITRMVEEGDALQVDMHAWTIRNLTNGKTAPIEPYSALVQRIIEAGMPTMDSVIVELMEAKSQKD